MPGPGEHLPDPTEGMTRVEDLPKPKMVKRSRDYRRRPCPDCGHGAYRDRRVKRLIHDVGFIHAPEDIGPRLSVQGRRVGQRGNVFPDLLGFRVAVLELDPFGFSGESSRFVCEVL